MQRQLSIQVDPFLVLLVEHLQNDPFQIRRGKKYCFASTFSSLIKLNV